MEDSETETLNGDEVEENSEEEGGEEEARVQGQTRVVRGVVAGEQVDLEPWLDPEVPAPGPVYLDADGWGKIDGLGGWECILTCFQAMEEVPNAHREKWGKAVALVVRRILDATTEEARTRALLWFLILPQALLRQAKRGGRKGQNAASVARRFDCVREGDWGSLLDMLEADKEVARRKKEARKQRILQEEEDMERKRETVLGLFAKGQVGRGARRIKSNGVANTDCPETMNALRTKYLMRRRPLPPTVSRGQCVDNLAGLRESMLGLEPGVSPGTGGMRGEFLITLAEVWSEEEMTRMEEFGMEYLNGLLPPWFYRVWGTVTTIPLFKTEQRLNSRLRPVGVKGTLVRMLHKYVARQNRATLESYLQPQQLCMTLGGAHKLVHCVRMFMEEHTDWVCVKCDVKNAHNEISRASILETMDSEPTLRHLTHHLATTLAMPSALETTGTVWGEAGDGLTQGDAEASGAFAVGWHPEVRELDAELSRGGGCCRFGNDDGYIMGPGEIVFPALENFANKIQRRCSLVLQREKTEVYCLGNLPPNTPADLPRAGFTLDGVFYPGFECYGIGIGTAEYIENFLQEKVAEIEEVVTKSCELLEGDRQALWTLLSSSVSQKFGYLLSLQYPSDIKAAATRLDTTLWGMLETTTGLHIPQQDEGLGVECVPGPPVQGLDTKSIQSWLVRLPVRSGGLGLRSMVDTIPGAFIGGVEMSLPHFGGEDGVCKLLEPVMGDIQKEPDASRWNMLLTSGCRTGLELAASWDLLQQEARECYQYLGKELEQEGGPLATPLPGLGEGRVDGSSRAKVVQQREEIRAAVLNQALQHYPDQTARPVWAFPQLDKISQAWILATPNPLTFLAGPVFREAMASHLFLPSPCCQDKVGKQVGPSGERVDPFGDNIMCAKLPFDTWRHRHDDCKVAIMERACHAKVEMDAEVFGLFRDLVPAAATARGGELEMVRARQGKVPDLAYRLPVQSGPQGQPDRLLAEIKAISAGSSRYPRGNRDKAADRRARALMGEYKGDLGKLDRQYLGTQQGQTGPLVARLEELVGNQGLQGLVIGRWGECSQNLHQLIQGLAEARALHLTRTSGHTTSDGQLSVILNSYRRILSCRFVRAQESCLLARQGHLDPGARDAAVRRRVLVREEERVRLEARAFYQAYVRGRGMTRTGQLARN